jgi:hypothetical protein
LGIAEDVRQLDVTHIAVSAMKRRLIGTFGESVTDEYEVIGEPTTVHDAAELAESDPYQFQWWALGLVGARPTEEKKGADRGIDGRIYFHDQGSTDTRTRQVVISVKAGKLHAQYVRDLRGVLEREGADLAVLLAMNQPTGLMKREAADAGFYESAWGVHPRLQIITVGELLEGAKINMPPREAAMTFKTARRSTPKAAEAPQLFES